MSEAANALADFLTKMDQKLDALDGKVERYSAYMVKKLNDTSDMGSQISAMERQIGAYLSPDTTNDAVIAKLNETADALQHTMERSINLIGYHGDRLQRRLTESVQQIENGLQERSAVFEKPEAVPEELHAVPENPEGTFEKPETAVFENPDAHYIPQPDVPVENPEPVIETGDGRKEPEV